MGKHESVRGGAAGGDAVAPPRLQVGRRVEAADVSSACGRDRSVGIGAPASTLDETTLVGHVSHPGRGGSHRAIVVEDRQHHGLEHDTLHEGALDGQHRRVREEQFAVGVAGDVTTEAVRTQPVRHLSIADHTRLDEMRHGRVIESEPLDGVDDPFHAGDHAVGPTGGQAPGEGFKDRPTLGQYRTGGPRPPS